MLLLFHVCIYINSISYATMILRVQNIAYHRNQVSQTSEHKKPKRETHTVQTVSCRGAYTMEKVPGTLSIDVTLIYNRN